MIVIYGIVLASVFVFLAAMCGVDRQQTLHLTAFGVAAVGVVVLAVALISTMAYAYDSRASTGDTLRANLRRDAPVRWLKQCALFVSLVTLMSGISSWYLCWMIVPYLPGTATSQFGTIDLIRVDGSRSAICTKYAVVFFDANPVSEEICLESGRLFRRRLTHDILGPGDRVSVQISHAVLGSAVKAITKVGMEPSETAGIP